MKDYNTNEMASLVSGITPCDSEEGEISDGICGKSVGNVDILAGN